MSERHVEEIGLTDKFMYFSIIKLRPTEMGNDLWASEPQHPRSVEGVDTASTS
jgi:hypothetical protein